MDLYQSSAVHYQSIPVGDATDQFWRLTHMVEVQDVQEDDLFIIHADHQYINDTGIWVELVNFISIDENTPLSGQEEDYDGSPPNLGAIGRSSIMGQNFHNQYGHYLVVNRNYFWRAPTSYNRLLFGLRVRARRISGSGGGLYVAAHYPNTPPQGQIQVIRVRE